MEISSIHQALTPLVGLPIRCIGRAMNLLWLQFGELHRVPNRRGGTKVVGDWAVHVQCPWRLIRHDRILVGYHDFYYTPDGGPAKDWHAGERTRFDDVTSMICAEFDKMPPVVASVQVDDVGGFSVRLSSEHRLDVFPDRSDETCDQWRIFQPGVDSKHFVFHAVIQHSNGLTPGTSSSNAGRGR
jgi:hypothetical protein